jgi:hypothetical protein
MAVWLATAALALWLALSFGFAFSSRARRRLARWNLFLQFNRWSLFTPADAPEGTLELRIRDRDGEGRIGPWRGAPYGPLRWSPSQLLWRPEKYLAALLAQLGARRRRVAPGSVHEPLEGSLAFSRIARCAIALPAETRARERQLMIVERGEPGAPAVTLVISPFYVL